MVKKICPKCKTEYREGFINCSDCGTDLIDIIEQDQVVLIDSKDSHRLIALGMGFLYVAFSQILIVIMVHEFYFVYLRSNGGVYGGGLQNIHPIIWGVIIIEILIAIIIIIWGFNFKKENKVN